MEQNSLVESRWFIDRKTIVNSLFQRYRRVSSSIVPLQGSKRIPRRRYCEWTFSAGPTFYFHRDSIFFLKFSNARIHGKIHSRLIANSDKFAPEDAAKIKSLSRRKEKIEKINEDRRSWIDRKSHVIIAALLAACSTLCKRSFVAESIAIGNRWRRGRLCRGLRGDTRRPGQKVYTLSGV